MVLIPIKYRGTNGKITLTYSYARPCLHVPDCLQAPTLKKYVSSFLEMVVKTVCNCKQHTRAQCIILVWGSLRLILFKFQVHTLLTFMEQDDSS